MMRIKRWYAVHDGGTKFYEVLFGRYETSTVVVQRWGAISSFGQVKVSTYGPNGEMEAVKVVNAKSKRGYTFKMDEQIVENDGQLEAYLVRTQKLVHNDVKWGLQQVLDAEQASGSRVSAVPKGPEPTRNEFWGSW
jgi:predicted DNA-binding WGR domain protein